MQQWWWIVNSSANFEIMSFCSSLDNEFLLPARNVPPRMKKFRRIFSENARKFLFFLHNAEDFFHSDKQLPILFFQIILEILFEHIDRLTRDTAHD